MKQLLQNFASGETVLEDVPCPQVRKGSLLIKTVRSVVSVGTEKMLVDFGKSSMFSKVCKQPEKVKQVLDKVRTDGILATYSAVMSKLHQPIPLGYSNAGVVVAVGEGVAGFAVGDRVLSNGSHAEYVCVPQNLCARIPNNVSYDQAAFGVIASIALQGIRLANPTIGETFVVFGLGLVGLFAVQLLVANGCKVIGFDFASDKVALAKLFGADAYVISEFENPVGLVQSLTGGNGADASIITASTISNEPIELSAKMCRKRGRIVLVGVAGLNINRADFYEKELTFQVSCSYGPGRYDNNYEEKGQDYPVGFVRWTEQRNFATVLALMSSKKVDVSALITNRYSFAEADKAYKNLLSDAKSVGVIFEYPTEENQTKMILLENGNSAACSDNAVVGLIGAGNFTSQILLPAIKKSGACLNTIVSNSGITAVVNGKKFGFSAISTDSESVFSDASVNTVFVTTRHNSHAEFVCRGLQSGKNVFVEKPLAISRTQLEAVQNQYFNIPEGRRPRLMVGFNRRFAPLAKKLKKLVDSMTEAKCIIVTVNAGEIPAEHWTQDKEIGGGRIVGEACHFIDFMRFLTGSEIVDASVVSVGKDRNNICSDKATISIGFADGSIGTIHYFANGSKAFPKERIEVFCSGRVAVLDNFISLRGYGFNQFSRKKLWSQDKGHAGEIAEFVDSIRTGKSSPIPANEIFEVTDWTIKIAEMLGNR
ncbi:MAG: bi-domain-containing oxidoreductase [Negativicutes bacterium]|jgi:predicted dehydrogenase/threonine dehydrogenase-like Zn-dependent dehydrogenase